MKYHYNERLSAKWHSLLLDLCAFSFHPIFIIKRIASQRGGQTEENKLDWVFFFFVESGFLLPSSVLKLVNSCKLNFDLTLSSCDFWSQLFYGFFFLSTTSIHSISWSLKRCKWKKVYKSFFEIHLLWFSNSRAIWLLTTFELATGISQWLMWLYQWNGTKIKRRRKNRSQ